MSLFTILRRVLERLDPGPIIDDNTRRALEAEQYRDPEQRSLHEFDD